MECNKEEAVRAMELAEKKMEVGDYIGGRKMALKAQKLYPDIDNVPQLLVVCDVHSSAAYRVNGDPDWYAILQIQRFSDEAVIRKHYKKLALSLHPDKNKCPGAEAAFKLIGEANRELTDPTKRALFDAKCRGLVQPALPKVTASHMDQTKGFTKKPTDTFPGGHPHQQAQKLHTGSGSYSQPQQQTFWTCCSSCKIKFQYYSNHLNQTLRCQNCQENFVATDVGPVGRQGIDVQGPSNGRNYAFAGVELRPNGGISSTVPGKSKLGVNGTFNADRTVCCTVPKRTARKGSGSSSHSRDNAGQNGEVVAPGSKRSRGKDEGENPSRKKSKAGDMHSKDNEANGLDSVHESGQQIECPVAEFNDFGKDRSVNCFDIDQMWAIYDEVDGMPRFYAKIKKVLSSGLKLQITWLEARLDAKEAGRKLPISCGIYEIGDQEELDRLVFSHQVSCSRGKEGAETYIIYPKKGETWALFKDWSSEPDKHCLPYSYEFVEILSEFDEVIGIGVACLGRVEGFVSIFQRATHDKTISFCVKPSELCRFSHRIPSRRMTGKERNGIPCGSFELDTAALPTSLYSSFTNAQLRKVHHYSYSANYKVESSTAPSQKAWTENEKFSGRNLVCGLSAVLPHGGRSQNNRSSVGRSQNSRNSVDGSGDCSSDGVAGTSQPPQGPSASSFQAKVKFDSVEKYENVEPVTRRSPRDSSKRNVAAGVNANPQPISIEDRDMKIDTPAKKKMDTPAKKKVELVVAKHNFEKRRTEDRFKTGQVWAIRSNEDRMPKNYALVKKIEYNPFKLHVAALESSAFTGGSNRTRGYGPFREGKTVVLPIARFSHEVEVVKSSRKNTHEIYPRKGEIWAAFKNPLESDQGIGQCHILEVKERKGEKVEVVALKSLMKFPGFESFYRPSNRSKSAMMEISRFSHQCPAYYHHDVLNGCWELDAASVPGQVILLE